MTKEDDLKREQQNEILTSYRDSIDNIDAALIHILAERFKITKKVGEFKARYGLAPADKDREQKQIDRLRILSEKARLDPDFSEKFLHFIITEVIRHHEQFRDDS
ncbi:Chorismate mutase I [hydrothermal vent metagenome]|uniref:Chorismate mutase I n=1 Tax=hydrothermal vent metagenome TaxID=652676 RepID=A0A3B0SF90_9ZZZZ